MIKNIKNHLLTYLFSDWIKNEKDVVEESKLEPLTDYSVFKAKCEEILLKRKK